MESYNEKADYCPACIRKNPGNKLNDSLNDAKNFSSRGAYKKFQEEINSSVDCMQTIASYIVNGLYEVEKKEGNGKGSSGFDNQNKPDLSPSFNQLPNIVNSSLTPTNIPPIGSNLNPFSDDENPSSTNPFGDF
ncbi:unnamed protein product [Dracunculus medinensis]|uniref:Uncharacterized protein n=1 Tax=Dracunculus medinensis TaxID=318479 RepID=A0A3P7QT80_DRAME|nr:unnamed protein product [Dracunculus medinensis]